MGRWFWCFFWYSFLGYLLEKSFARAVRAEKQTRKCFLLLPLCPVYGLAMTAAALLLPAEMDFFVLVVLGGAVCTGTEYLVHLLYDRVFGVWFWDYRELRGNFRGRVCPQFTMIWGLLSAAALRLLQPGIETLSAAAPPWLTYGMWLLLAVDAVCSGALLRRYHDTELLALPAFAAARRGDNPAFHAGEK